MMEEWVATVGLVRRRERMTREFVLPVIHAEDLFGAERIARERTQERYPGCTIEWVKLRALTR